MYIPAKQLCMFAPYCEILVNEHVVWSYDMTFDLKCMFFFLEAGAYWFHEELQVCRSFHLCFSSLTLLLWLLSLTY